MKNAKLKKLVQFTTLSAFLLLTGVETASARDGDSHESSELQQSKTRITGTVVDRTGEPVIGASIIEKGVASNGTLSDADGQFSLDVSQGATLAVSFLGYVKQEIAVGTQTQLQITLQEDLQALEEVVVVGYGVQKKRDLTGAISSVKVAEMPVQTYSTISHALAGKAAGLQVTQTSAQVGGGAKFRIRGETSTGAGNEPLIIIDGFPVSSTDTRAGGEFANGSTDNLLESLNPNDIESIEILKDASSTAIYGSRAGHGVIIVTTKRGKEQKPAITYSGNTTVQTISKHYDMLDAREFMVQRNMMMYEEYLRENALSVYAPYVTLDAAHVTPDFTPIYSEQEIANAQTTNWTDEITRPGVQQSHNISMTGGNESTRYLTSANYFKQDGIIKNDGMTRFTARFNLDQRLSRFVKVGITLSLSQNQYQNIALDAQYTGVLASAVQFNPNIPVYDINGDYSIDRERLTADNPVALLDITDNSSRDRLLGMAYIEVEPIKGLTLKASLGADRRNAKRETYYPKTVNVGKATGGRADISESDAKDYLMDLTATWTKAIGAHNFTALAGYSWQGFSNKGVSASNTEFLFDNFTFNNLGFGNAARPGVGSWADKNSLGSYFARVNYSFLGRYLLTATVRADGDSDFNPEYRWGYFPSASLGWRFSDEAFMQPFTTWLSNGKLRVSYGQTGNSNVGNRIMDTYGYVNEYTFAESRYSGYGITQLGNPKLKWETTTEFNLGLDLGFLNGRFNLTAEYYNRVISDLLAEKSLLSYNEVTKIYANIGKTQGQGVEITLNTVNMKGRDFEWSSDFTWSRYRDRWLERDPEWKPTVYMSETDYIRSYYTVLSDGLMQAGEERPVYNRTMLPGQIKAKDISGEDGVPDGKINDYDIVYKGTTDPDFYFGVNNTLRYKNFDLNIYFYGEINKISGNGSYYEADLNRLRGGQNVSPLVAEAWRHNNQDASYQSLFTATSPWGDYHETKVSYVRCRNITLGYILPLSTKIVQRARVYVDVNNPFVITNWNGLDPETDLGSYSTGNRTVGLASNPFPNVRSFTLGVDITF